MATTYANLLSSVQSAFYTCLSTDSSVTAYTAKIFDGIPSFMLRGEGFPYIIIHNPRFKEEILRLRKKHITITQSIEIWDTQEGKVRTIMDAVKQSFVSGEAANFAAADLRIVFVESGSTDFAVQPDHNVFYTGTLVYTLRWDEA